MTRKRAYHHGDLRRALLDEAIRFLGRGDVTALTMGQVAKLAGVSSGAPYHHFADKPALLGALAEEGFSELLVRMQESERCGDPLDRLRSLAAAYLAFAAEHPAHYRVMFLPDVADRERFAALHDKTMLALEKLVITMHAVDPTAPRETIVERSIAVWAAVHGFASLRDQRVVIDKPELPRLDRLIEGVLRVVVAAALPPPPRPAEEAKTS